MARAARQRAEDNPLRKIFIRFGILRGIPRIRDPAFTQRLLPDAKADPRRPNGSGGRNVAGRSAIGGETEVLTRTDGKITLDRGVDLDVVGKRGVDGVERRKQLALGDQGKNTIVGRLLGLIADGVMELFRTGKRQEQQPLTQQNHRQQWARHFRNTRRLAGRWHARQLSGTSPEIQAANGDRFALYAYRNNPDISQPPALPPLGITGVRPGILVSTSLL